MFCKYCGKQLNDDDAFCGACGGKTREDEPQNEQVSAPNYQYITYERIKRGVGRITVGTLFAIASVVMLIIFAVAESKSQSSYDAWQFYLQINSGNGQPVVWIGLIAGIALIIWGIIGKREKAVYRNDINMNYYNQ